jgi:hypothetical protein
MIGPGIVPLRNSEEWWFGIKTSKIYVKNSKAQILLMMTKLSNGGPANTFRNFHATKSRTERRG